jgi:hypothetical protein
LPIKGRSSAGIAFQFYGQVGDAAARIQLARREDGARGADIDAGRALAAVGARGRIHRQRQIKQKLAHENIEPAVRDSSSVCLPRQPSPAFSASGSSITGAESVNTR